MLRHAIRQYLKKQVAEDQRFCLLLRDANEADSELIDFLGSIGDDPELHLPLCQLVLIASSDFGTSLQRLSKPGSFTHPTHRISVEAMSEEDSISYMQHRIGLVADHLSTKRLESFFSIEICRQIYKATLGNPAAINTLGDTSLQIASEAGSSGVLRQHVFAASRRLNWNRDSLAMDTIAGLAEGECANPETAIKRVSAERFNSGSLGSSADTLIAEDSCEGVLERSVHRLFRNVTTIGTAADCGIRIDDDEVSPYQVLIVKSANGLVIRNAGGDLPIFVNAKKVENASLSLGDIVTIGNRNFEVARDDHGHLALVSQDSAVQA